MAAHAVTLQIPAPLYDLISTRAERAQRSLEAELLDAVVATVAADEEEMSRDLSNAVAALEHLSDSELQLAARNSFSGDERWELDALNLKQQREELAPFEQERLEKLIQHYDRAVLIRAEALRLLKGRGFDVTGLLTAR